MTFIAGEDESREDEHRGRLRVELLRILFLVARASQDFYSLEEEGQSGQLDAVESILIDLLDDSRCRSVSEAAHGGEPMPEALRDATEARTQERIDHAEAMWRVDADRMMRITAALQMVGAPQGDPADVIVHVGAQLLMARALLEKHGIKR